MDAGAQAVDAVRALAGAVGSATGSGVRLSAGAGSGPVPASGLGFGMLLGAIALLGASVQRLSGIGFGLVCVPAFVLLVGPEDGVTLANCGTAAVSVLGLAGGWRHLRPAAMLPLVVAAGCTVPIGALVAARLPEDALLVGTGLLIGAAVLAVMGGLRVPALRGTGGAVAAGAASGVMNSAAGVGGPAVSLYAVNAGWTAKEFVPNALFYGVVVNIMSLVAKSPPALAAPAWGLIAAGIVAGSVLGWLLAARIAEHHARRFVLLLALLGGVTTLGKGLWGMWGT